MAIVIVPQLADNFAYLISDDASGAAAVVDCSEAGKVLAEVKRQGVRLTAVLSTHWHGDHVGGNQELAAAVPGLKVYGARAENGRIPALTDPVNDGDEIAVGALHARVLGIPAHTNGHVAYYFPALKCVFTGDTLFIGGCGRLFEGGAQTMMDSLAKLAALPDDTRVYCGHEYTEKNLRFALTLEPGNRELGELHRQAVQAGQQGKWTVPSTIASEKQVNPFLRVNSPELRASLTQLDPSFTAVEPVAVFARVRQLKDRF